MVCQPILWVLTVVFAHFVSYACRFYTFCQFRLSFLHILWVLLVVFTLFLCSIRTFACYYLLFWYVVSKCLCFVAFSASSDRILCVCLSLSMFLCFSLVAFHIVMYSVGRFPCFYVFRLSFSTFLCILLAVFHIFMYSVSCFTCFCMLCLWL